MRGREKGKDERKREEMGGSQERQGHHIENENKLIDGSEKKKCRSFDSGDKIQEKEKMFSIVRLKKKIIKK